MTKEETKKYWNEQVKKLEGKTIVKARYIDEEVADCLGWDKLGLVIVFDDETSMILSQDDEGNGPGSAFTDIEELEAVPSLQR